ncbi:MAG TPA: hypothetical protein VFZ83_05145 [Acidimicrobiia bacterium]|nr:hypothetical protein [Acidimicrobiia bacterium]
MFVQDFIEVPISGDRVLDHASRRAWLAPLALAAATGRAAADVHAEPPAGQVGYLDVGVPRARGDAVLVPLRWDVEPEPGVVLAMSADLEVVPAGEDRTHVALCASYARPFGRSTTDRALQRNAAHVVRRLLLAIATELERETTALGDRR